MSKEKIIVRREYNRYMNRWGYLVGFPEEKANPGRINCVSCYCDAFGQWRFECTSEADLKYFRNRKLVHKNTADANAVKSAIEQLFDDEFEVVEKIIKGMEVY